MLFLNRPIQIRRNCSLSRLQIYEDQVHGFALRSDWSSEKDKKAMVSLGLSRNERLRGVNEEC